MRIGRLARHAAVLLACAAAVPVIAQQAGDVTSVPADVPAIVREIDARRERVRALVDGGAFTEIWVPAFEAKSLALAIDNRRDQVPPAERSRAGAAVTRLVRAAWLLDAMGDLGNRRQIAAAYTEFASAVSALDDLFPPAAP